jgi:hypothetical protein
MTTAMSDTKKQAIKFIMEHNKDIKRPACATSRFREPVTVHIPSNNCNYDSTPVCIQENVNVWDLLDFLKERDECDGKEGE